MGLSSPRGEQEMGGDEDDEEDGSRPQAAASSRPHSTARFFTKNAKSEKKYQKRSKWLPCFFSQRRRQVDKATSTTGLNEMEDAPPIPNLVDQQEKPPAMEDLFSRPDVSLANKDETGIELSTCYWISSSPFQRRTPFQDQSPTGEHSPHRNSPPARNSPPNRDEPPDRNTPPRSYREAPVRRDESPNRESFSGKDSPVQESSPTWRNSPGWKKSTGGKRSSEWRRSPGWKRSYDWRSSNRKTSREWRKSPGSKRSPDRNRSRYRRRSPGGHMSHGRERSPGRKDVSPRRRESVIRYQSHGKTKSAPVYHLPSPVAKSIQHKKVKRRMSFGSTTWLLFWLLVAMAVFFAVHTYPTCVSKTNWVVLPRETLLLELVSVSLLVLATASILILVNRSISILIELVVAFILVLLNTSLVDLVRCLCFIPGRCFWLTALVIPLFLLTCFVLCREKMMLLKEHT